MKKFYYLLIILSTLLFSSSFVIAYADDDEGEEIDVTVLLPDQSANGWYNSGVFQPSSSSYDFSNSIHLIKVEP